LNGFSENKTPAKLDSNDYQVFLVANKYQTGFDQLKLCAMYILKRLKGVNAVQTFSRLNRICLPYDKTIFILDFVNQIEDIEKAFASYYTTTLLCNSTTPELIYEIENKIDSYYLYSEDDVEQANELYYNIEITPFKKEQKMVYLLSKTKKNFRAMMKRSK